MIASTAAGCKRLLCRRRNLRTEIIDRPDPSIPEKATVL
jgi:hypothetical protein